MLTRGFRMKLDLESRIRRLEDRVSIVETVTRYCVGVDSKDWVLFASCFAPRMRTEFGEMNREEFVAIVQSALPAFRSTAPERKSRHRLRSEQSRHGDLRVRYVRTTFLGRLNRWSLLPASSPLLRADDPNAGGLANPLDCNQQPVGGRQSERSGGGNGAPSPANLTVHRTLALSTRRAARAERSCR